MRTIWKTELSQQSVQKITVPKGAEFLTAAFQAEKICVWYRCDPTAEKEERWISIVGTGHDCPPDWDYLSQIQFFGGQLVFHVFVKPL